MSSMSDEVIVPGISAPVRILVQDDQLSPFAHLQNMPLDAVYAIWIQ